MNIDIEKLKYKLKEEKRHLEADLNSIGVKSEETPGNWNSTPDQTADISTRDEVAERMEELSTRQATEMELEPRLKEVNAALERIEAGTFGKCEVGGEEIEADRLEANPAARTCKQHINQTGK